MAGVDDAGGNEGPASRSSSGQLRRPSGGASLPVASRGVKQQLPAVEREKKEREMRGLTNGSTTIK
jgi:hypothetical protein